jgi:hypothetical protein
MANGMKYTDILNPVQGNGAYAADFPLFGGQHIWKAVPVILEALQNAGRLMATQTITHSYPHCWRHKTPVIYRAAAQWFIRMDAFDSTTEKTTGKFITDKSSKSLRELALHARKRPRTFARHDCQPPRLVHLAPTQLGRARAVLLAQRQRRVAPTHHGHHGPSGGHC